MSTARDQYVVDGKGKRTAVIISARKYKRLMEDLHDLAVVAQRREEKSISLATLKKRLSKDGLL
jgi:PHD/YefM family antitoxin component YafN of YafNO toxin-antitoxin module